MSIPPLVLLCECNSFSCVEALAITEDIFRMNQRNYPQCAQVVPGHEDPTDEVLERHPDYLIVREEC